MNAPASTTITPIQVADLLAEGERMPVYVHVVEHPDARVLVDTGMTELHPAVADLDPRLRPLSEHDIDETLARLRKHGAELVSSDVVQYEDAYRLCYIRGPEGLLIGLAQELG